MELREEGRRRDSECVVAVVREVDVPVRARQQDRGKTQAAQVRAARFVAGRAELRRELQPNPAIGLHRRLVDHDPRATASRLRLQVRVHFSPDRHTMRWREAERAADRA